MIKWLLVCTFFVVNFDNAQAVGPIEVTSQNGFTCDLKTNICTATGDVVTKSESSVLKSDQIQAFLAPKATSIFLHSDDASDSSGVAGKKQSLHKLTASGNIRFQSQKGGILAKGEQAQFDVMTEELRLWGKATVEQGKAKLFVGKYLVFYAGSRMATAIGRSTLRYEDKLLQADTIRVFFEPDEQGRVIFSRMEAEGNVVLSTKTELATAKRAVYRDVTKVAELFDNVVITKPEGQLNGQYVRYDLVTGQSQIKSLPGNVSGNTTLSNRVQIVLEPSVAGQKSAVENE